MTVVSVAQATSRLGIAAKTLHRWLAEAQLPLHPHPSDGRQKGVSLDHLQTLARLHHRSLTPLPQESPPPTVNDEPPWLTALLALPDHLATLQAQVASLRTAVADLTRLLPHHTAEPASAATPNAPTRPSVKPASPTLPSAGGVSPTSRAPHKPVHVIPRVEYASPGRYVVICPQHGLLSLEPDTPAWVAWLGTQSSFRFMGKGGTFSAHHEWRVPRGAWRAHRHIRNHGYSLRLAPTAELTIAVLEQTAEALQAHLM